MSENIEYSIFHQHLCYDISNNNNSFCLYRSIDEYESQNWNVIKIYYCYMQYIGTTQPGISIVSIAEYKHFSFFRCCIRVRKSAFVLFFLFLLPTERRGFIVWKCSLKLLLKKRFVPIWINPAAEVAATAYKRNDVVLHLFEFVYGKCCECFHWWKIIDRICIIWKSRRTTNLRRSLSSFRYVWGHIDVCHWLYSVCFSIAYTFIHLYIDNNFWIHVPKNDFGICNCESEHLFLMFASMETMKILLLFETLQWRRKLL